MDKAKKKKIIIAAVAVFAAAAVAVTSVLIAVKKKNDDFYNSADGGETTVKYDENYIPPDSAGTIFELDYAESEPVEHNKKLDAPVKADTSGFIKELESKDIAFEYAKHYETAKHIKNQRPLDRVEKHKYDVTDGSGVIDENVLYDTVVKNNDKYFAEMKNSDDVPCFEKSSKKYIKLTCHYIAEYVNKAKASGEWNEVDFNRVFCNLATLKIMHRISGDFSLAFVDENNILSVNPETIDNSKTMAAPDTDMTDKEMEQFVWDETLVHEIMHLLQDSCPCIEKDDEFLLGNMRMPDGEEDAAHPLCNFWFAEASAELGMTKMLNIEPVTYQSFINYYYSVLLSFGLDPELSPEKIMNITYDKDCYPFYKAFGKLSEKETEEIVNMFYNIEVMSNDPDSFIKWYEKKNGINLLDREDVHELVKQKLRLEVLKCLTKHFYINLAKQAKVGKMSYNDMLYLIKQFERAMYEHQLYEQEDRAMTSNLFFDDYLKVQDAFFDAVSSKSVTKEELANGLESYTEKCMNGNKSADNFNFIWMTEEQRYAVKMIHGNYNFINLPTIRGAKSIYTQKGYDKSKKY